MGFFCTFSPFFPILSAHSFSLSLPLLFFLPPGTPPPLFPHLQSHVGWKKKKLADNNPQRTVQFGEAVITHPKKQRYVLGAALGPWDGMEPHESHVAPSEGGDPIGDGGQRGGRAVGFGRHVAKQSPAAGMDGGSGPRARQLGAKSVGVVWGWGAGGGETRRMGEVKKKPPKLNAADLSRSFFFRAATKGGEEKKRKRKKSGGGRALHGRRCGAALAAVQRCICASETRCSRRLLQSDPGGSQRAWPRSSPEMCL